MFEVEKGGSEVFSRSVLLFVGDVYVVGGNGI